METDIFLLVIFASILHASWNGMVKKFKDKIISVSAIVYGHVPIAILVMFFVPLPPLESLPYIILSAVIHESPLCGGRRPKVGSATTRLSVKLTPQAGSSLSRFELLPVGGENPPMGP